VLVGEHVVKLGATFALSDMGGDPATVRLFAQAAEAAGYDHPGADHVLGVSAESRPKWAGLHRRRRRGKIARGIQVLEVRRRHSAFKRNHHRGIASRSLRARPTALERYRDAVADLL
jgi:hypothetical protein